MNKPKTMVINIDVIKSKQDELAKTANDEHNNSSSDCCYAAGGRDILDWLLKIKNKSVKDSKNRLRKGPWPRSYLVKNSNIMTMKTFSNKRKAEEYRDELDNRERQFMCGNKVTYVGLAHIYKLVK